jgi:hypothetical protein
VGPGPVWTGAEILAPIGIRSADRPARSQSLYRLSYPGPANSGMLVYFLRCEDNNKMNLTLTGCKDVEWFQVAKVASH